MYIYFLFYFLLLKNPLFSRQSLFRDRGGTTSSPISEGNIIVANYKRARGAGGGWKINRFSIARLSREAEGAANVFRVKNFAFDLMGRVDRNRLTFNHRAKSAKADRGEPSLYIITAIDVIDSNSAVCFRTAMGNKAVRLSSLSPPSPNSFPRKWSAMASTESLPLGYFSHVGSKFFSSSHFSTQCA